MGCFGGRFSAPDDVPIRHNTRTAVNLKSPDFRALFGSVGAEKVTPRTLRPHPDYPQFGVAFKADLIRGAPKK
jgi:hypothetical protein